MTFKMADMALKIVGVTVFPWAFIIEFTLENKNKKGKSKQDILRYVLARLANSPSPPMSFMTKGLAMIPMAANKVPRIRLRATNWVAYFLASFTFSAPINCDKREVPATDMPIPRDTNKKLIGQTKDTAAK